MLLVFAGVDSIHIVLQDNMDLTTLFFL